MRPLIVLLPLLALAACDKQKTEAPQAQAQAASSPSQRRVDTSHKGEAQPTTPFLGPDGSPATLSQFRGKPLLVNLWATWCAPCVAELPSLDRLAEREKGRLQLIVVSQDIEGKRAVDPFFAKNKFVNLKPYLDKQNVLPLAYKGEILPMTILYDAQGKEEWRVLSAMDWQGETAKALLARSLK